MTSFAKGSLKVSGFQILLSAVYYSHLAVYGGLTDSFVDSG